TPVFWNVAIIVGLVLGVPHAHTIDAKLYVYAVAIVIATLIQFLLPLPWLRGRDGRLQLVIDWRDPAVKQVFVLMLPVTLGLGLTPVVAGALAAFSLGLTFNGAMLMLNRAFFSLQSPWLPTVIAVANLALNAALDGAFYRLGTWGIPLSTSLVNIAGTALLLLLLRRRLRRIEFARTADAT